MNEILHRIDLAQGLLFRQISEALESRLANINKANQELSDAIDDIDDISGFLKSAASFLKAVDEAIDVAKTLAPLVA